MFSCNSLIKVDYLILKVLEYAYSNLGYVLLGQLIEKVTGLPYEIYITNSIIYKLGLNENELSLEIVKENNHAKEYNKKVSFSNLILGFFIDKSKYMPTPSLHTHYRHFPDTMNRSAPSPTSKMASASSCGFCRTIQSSLVPYYRLCRILVNLTPNAAYPVFRCPVHLVAGTNVTTRF